MDDLFNLFDLDILAASIRVSIPIMLAALGGLALALLAGAMVGYINGILVARIGVPSIMATLAAQFFWYGVTVLLAGGLQSALKTIEDNSVHATLTGRIYGIIPNPERGRIGIPTQALWALALAVFLWFILNRHKFGEAVMFIGDNPNVARVMGVNVEATRIQLFTMMGTIAAFAGVILTLEMRVFYPTQGQGMLLPVMAAVFIGGTSIAGGVGSIVGTFFGSYIIGSLEAGVVATGISGFWVQLVQGLVMGTSVVLNTVLGSKRAVASKTDPYECGLPSEVQSNFRFGISFYLIAMLFILFDIEVIFLYPIAVQLKAFGTFALVETLVFIFLLFVAFIYVWRRGALEWR